MRDFELYQAVLGLQPPWSVVNVDLDVKSQQVVVTVEAGPEPYPCPTCQAAVPSYDRKLRQWRHLDTCQFTTWIQAAIPRVSCPTHGVKQLAAPWAEPGSQFTALFERLAIDLLQECSVTGGARLLRISWDEAWGIKARAVSRETFGVKPRNLRGQVFSIDIFFGPCYSLSPWPGRSESSSTVRSTM